MFCVDSRKWLWHAFWWTSFECKWFLFTFFFALLVPLLGDQSSHRIEHAHIQHYTPYYFTLCATSWKLLNLMLIALSHMHEKCTCFGASNAVIEIYLCLLLICWIVSENDVDPLFAVNVIVLKKNAQLTLQSWAENIGNNIRKLNEFQPEEKSSTSFLTEFRFVV